MSYEQKRNLISLNTLILVSIPYIGYIINRYSSESFATAGEEMSFWASVILVLIPVRIVAEIVGHIVLAIGNAIATGEEDIDTTVDERDDLIGLKSTRNSYYVFTITIFFAMLFAGINESIGTLFVILMFGGTFAELMEIGSKIFYYRRGY